MKGSAQLEAFVKATREMETDVLNLSFMADLVANHFEELLHPSEGRIELSLADGDVAMFAVLHLKEMIKAVEARFFEVVEREV